MQPYLKNSSQEMTLLFYYIYKYSSQSIPTMLLLRCYCRLGFLLKRTKFRPANHRSHGLNEPCIYTMAPINAHCIYTMALMKACEPYVSRLYNIKIPIQGRIQDWRRGGEQQMKTAKMRKINDIHDLLN